MGLCGWCRKEPATTVVLATESCKTCADGGRAVRVSRWADGITRKVTIPKESAA